MQTQSVGERPWRAGASERGRDDVSVAHQWDVRGRRGTGSSTWYEALWAKTMTVDFMLRVMGSRRTSQEASDTNRQACSTCAAVTEKGLVKVGRAEARRLGQFLGERRRELDKMVAEGWNGRVRF